MEPRVELFWLPLGAGGHFIAFNGRCYEALIARRQRRPTRNLFHAALTIQTAVARYTVELTPVIGMGDEPRGVVAEGPVGARWAGRSKAFRYEIRVWEGGVIPDLAYAVDSPVVISTDPAVADHLLALAPSIPRLTWGRDESGTGDMWNSNSVISWLLVRGGADEAAIQPPSGGRAPGWEAGVAVARAAASLS